MTYALCAVTYSLCAVTYALCAVTYVLCAVARLQWLVDTSHNEADVGATSSCSQSCCMSEPRMVVEGNGTVTVLALVLFSAGSGL